MKKDWSWFWARRVIDTLWLVVLLMLVTFLVTCDDLHGSVPCAAEDVELTAGQVLVWDAVEADPPVAGYRVYWQHADGQPGNYGLLVNLPCVMLDYYSVCPGPRWTATYTPAAGETEFWGLAPFRYLDDLDEPIYRRFYVTAYNADGESAPSNVVEVCTGTVWAGPPQPPVEGIAIGAVTWSTNGNNVTSVTWSHTVGASDTVLVVGVTSRDTVDGERLVTSVTYGGSALALVRQADEPVNNVYSSLWYLVNPPAGAHSIVATYVGAVTEAFGVAASLEGVDAQDPIVTHAGYTQAGGTFVTQDIDTLVDGALVLDVQYAGAASVTATSGQAPMVDEPVGIGRSQDRVLATTTGPVLAGTTTLEYAYSESSQVALSMVVLRPAPVAP